MAQAALAVEQRCSLPGSRGWAAGPRFGARAACPGCDGARVSSARQGTLVCERHRAQHSYRHTDTDSALPAAAGTEQKRSPPGRNSHPLTSSGVLLLCLPYIYTHRRQTLQPSWPALWALFACPQSLCPVLAPSTSRTKSLTSSQMDFCSLELTSSNSLHCLFGFQFKPLSSVLRQDRSPQSFLTVLLISPEPQQGFQGDHPHRYPLSTAVSDLGTAGSGH